MASGFKINKQAIRQMTREIEKEFAKNPVRIPLEASSSGIRNSSATTVNNYHGPVVTVTGDHAQIAWGNATSNQNQERVEQIAPGFEKLAGTIAELLTRLETIGLDDEDSKEIRSNADEVLKEVVKDNPSPTVIRRGLIMIKGLLAPLSAGASKVATEESAKAARSIIEALGDVFPS